MLHTQHRCHIGHAATSSFPAAPRAYMQRPTLRCCSARTSVATTAEADAAPSTSTSASHAPSVSGKVAVFAASKQQSQPVQEQQRPLAEYMALPASQYSVLDARKIERVDDTTFRCYVGGLNFLNFSVEPVITVSVTVEDKGCTIKLLSCRLQGSKAVEEVNDKFSATMTNMVRWEASEEPHTKLITSTTSIEVVVQVPGWVSFLPVGGIEAAGRQVMQGTLNAMVPRFLAQLQKDYELWASGDSSRQPIGDGEL